jgi:hypothetical protein
VTGLRITVAGRDIWRGVSLADQVLADAAEGSEPWADAGSLVLAGDALRTAAGYGHDEDLSADVDHVRELLADRSLSDATAALVARVTGEGGATDTLTAPADLDLGTAVRERDDDALRRAAAAELRRQLELYR